ncbi:hypothetical protein [Azospirillum rugosum]|uniref:Uncharacterized protein n=1 Tax=Azospirillum rugosum TaxID=416170 RepID=A0ABS4SN57_9PROT|nr:hypothetical protein [Azospirillum rugosum]MBP2294003.1 hypothetical protein [Azospirillum rugosum]MDQ0526810.1 hypothetical protein [Azospirillum rugosum]
MKRLHEGSHLIHYGQVALWDHEDRRSYPAQFGPFPWIGPKGVVVGAASDGEIAVEVYGGAAGEAPPAGLPPLRVTCRIAVGGDGVEVGNVTTASTARVAWPPGLTEVAVHAGGDAAARVVFVLRAPA